MKKLLSITAAVLLAFTLFGCKEEKSETLKVYSIIHDEETQMLLDLFEKETGIKGEYIRATTGELVNRVLSEKADPQADVLLGGASSYHILLSADGALESYKSPVAKDFPSYALSPDNTYTGFCVLTLGIGINSKRFEEKFPGIARPATWEDLLNPAFKDEIVLTNPLASSTAYLFVQNQLQRLGWDAGWKYLETLAPLVGQFPDSGSAPAKLVGTGEYTLGVSYIHAVEKYKDQGFDVETVAPPQSVGDVDCISILKNAKNMNAAKKFTDFILGAKAQEEMSKIDFTIPVNSSARIRDGAVKIKDLDLIEYDSKKAADEKDKALKEWAERCAD